MDTRLRLLSLVESVQTSRKYQTNFAATHAMLSWPKNLKRVTRGFLADQIMLETPILFLIGLLVLCAVVWWFYRK